MNELLIVDDDATVLQSLMRACRSDAAHPALTNLRISTFDSPHDALAHGRYARVDVVLAGFRMSAMNRAAFFERMRALHPDAFHVALRAVNDRHDVVAAIGGARMCSYIDSPWCDDDLRSAVSDAFAARAAALAARRVADEIRMATSMPALSHAVMYDHEPEPEPFHPVRIAWTSDGGILLV